jgi:hypothetical protein
MRGEIDETVFKLTQLQNEDLMNIILDYQLNTPSRIETSAYKRYYLYNYMYNYRHMTYSMIGKFFQPRPQLCYSWNERTQVLVW